MTSAIKAVIFDWAGTMVDFGCVAPVEALIAAFAAEGVTIDAALARRDMGRAKRDHVEALLAQPEARDAWASAKGAPASEADVDRIFTALGPLMTQAAGRHSDLIPGAAAVVADLRAQGVRIGSGTGYTHQMMTAILPRAAAQGYAPEVVVCAGDTPSGRPSPLMVWRALIDLDAWPAFAAVKVDDAEVGIEEGVAAGCWTVGVAGSGNGVGLSLADYRTLGESDRASRTGAAAASLRAAGADFVVETVADLPPVLQEISTLIAAGARPGQAAARDYP